MQQELAKQQQTVSVENPVTDGDEDGTNTNNNIEEKVPSTNSLSEEFLHEHHTTAHLDALTKQNHELKNSDVYVAYHGELHVPPPNA